MQRTWQFNLLFVWRSIADHFDEVDFDNDYISVARVARSSLEKHPWSLGGGGASELKELLEERASSRLGELIKEIGRSTHTGEDSVFFMSEAGARRLGFSRFLVPLVKGEQVRDWSITDDEISLFPYDMETAEPVAPSGRDARYYWIYRTLLRDRQDFGEKIEARGLTWFEHAMFFPQRFLRPLGITFSFVATHNHFALERGGKVFNRTAPIIKLPEGATEDDHLALLAYLNSSVACFWMKQVSHKKSSASQKHHNDPARAAYEFTATALQDLPVPALTDPVLTSIARRIFSYIEERKFWLSGGHVHAAGFSEFALGDNVERLIAAGWNKHDRATQSAAYLQEELDWHVYEKFGLSTLDIVLDVPDTQVLGRRPFEIEVGYDAGVSARVRNAQAVVRSASPEMPPHWRMREIDSPEIRLMETREFKRAWRDTEQNVDEDEFRRTVSRRWLEEVVLVQLEDYVRTQTEVTALRTLVGIVQKSLLGIADFLSEDVTELTRRLAKDDAVPFSVALTLTDAGMASWAAWEQTWEQQRLEEQGEDLVASVPPKFGQDDFAEARYWSLRGKLNVPKERFISYPGCESDNDSEPVYGWAGWDHLQRAQALATLYLKRKDGEGWTRERLTPCRIHAQESKDAMTKLMECLVDEVKHPEIAPA